jgi:cell division protein FtsI/penicillin-binding protein 2/cell division protein FtsW (lipid II flippase)
MKVSREELAARSEERIRKAKRQQVQPRYTELIGLVLASLAVITGLFLVYSAKAAPGAEEPKAALNLNQLTGPQQLNPYLGIFSSTSDQDFVARHIFEAKRHGKRFGNVGALGTIRIRQAELPRTHGSNEWSQRIAEAQRRLRGQGEPGVETSGLRRLWPLHNRDSDAELTIPLLTPAEVAALKPYFRVRERREYRNQLLIWSALFLAGFYAVHVWWRVRGFRGDNLLLPVMHALSGIGLILMVSLRDPVRDTLMFSDFALGVVVGCAALVLFSLPDYQRQFSRLSFVPLLVAFLLAVALGVFGSGPGGSDAKVNLFFFQPVEIIRVLLVFFLAGYFAQNWDALRHLQQRPESSWNALRRFRVPRLDYLIPVAAAVALSIVLFFWLSDLGPALVIGCLFLTMYSVARNRILLPAAGLALIILAFAVGYVTGYPHTVRDRVEMWKSPWDNHVRGGDQVADSLWTLSTGGGTGTGFGLGDAQTMPAAHTDLIISAFGEQAGLIGIIALYALYAVLIWRSTRTALNARGTYSFFLVIGLALIIAYQLLLISGGLLGLIPLSGVVSPFLSYGKTSMVANFAVFGIILAISARDENADQRVHFGAGTRTMLTVLAACALVVLARFSWVQVVRADNILVRPSLVMQADGARRYQYNPRLLKVARDLPKGTIYDRNNIPLATSNRSLIEAHRDDYQKLGITLDQTTSETNGRQYPLGPAMFYLLGDVRSRLKQGATNTAFEENVSRIRLQGYDDVAELEEVRDSRTGQVTTTVRRDYRALIPLIRHRFEPNDPAVQELRTRPRDVHMSIDAPLQMRAAKILAAHLTKLGKKKGALVIMDPATGDMLSAVSYPAPSETEFAVLKSSQQAPLPDPDLLDRARFGLYPPGSSFKIVTTIAALRKDPALAQQRYDCVRLPDGRVGQIVRNREIRDDIQDKQPHGSVDMQKGITVSCNAYFAQLGADAVGANMLFDTANRLGLSVARPNTPAKLRDFLPQAAYGQGQVVVSPFQMARVAATIANGGSAPEGRWIIDESNQRIRPPEPLLSENLARQVGGYMRSVVTSGTARILSSSRVPIAGKTGTAELANAASHAWFIGFAPYGVKSGKQIAFAVLVENGQYGGSAAAPIAGDIVAAAHELGII